MVAVWPSVVSKRKGKSPLRIDDTLIRNWSAVAAVPEEFASSMHPGLIACGVIDLEGRVAPLTAQYITAAAFAAAGVDTPRPKKAAQT
ncbi:MAG: hypothetical protein EKK55_01155 [Rhodocyclaceae bacterium]|nr:MAG: hypothetical protein EKK55_01155 [Rhodocyclaceae bacterium]